VTALHSATESRDVELARLLIEAGADLKAADEDGITALHEAATDGCEFRGIITLLLAHGVHIARQYRDGTIFT